MQGLGFKVLRVQVLELVEGLEFSRTLQGFAGSGFRFVACCRSHVSDADLPCPHTTLKPQT